MKEFLTSFWSTLTSFWTPFTVVRAKNAEMLDWGTHGEEAFVRGRRCFQWVDLRARWARKVKYSILP